MHFVHNNNNQLRGWQLKLHLLIAMSSIHCSVIYNKPNKPKNHTSNPFISYLLFYRMENKLFVNPGNLIFQISMYK